MAYKWKLTIRLGKSGTQVVFVDADSSWNAKAMVEAQYGKGCILMGPQKV